ncbi:MAG: class I SAM-dependent methyltransferase [Candidatus Kerfeldbacteria bacterium]|nr:class I SAM-dependent methyltransferase [Candidatus Kerfeldbacteria bacterium]
MTTTNQAKFTDQNPIQQWLIRHFQQRFIALLKTVQPRSILEVGCGEGYLLNVLRQEFTNVNARGLDVNDRALAEGKRLFPFLDLRPGDIYQIPETDRSWDVVIASEVLEHLDRPSEALRELGRVADRYVLLTVPNEPWFRLGNLGRGRHLKRFGNHPEHVNLWSKSSFASFVSKTLKPTRITGSFPWTIVLAEPLDRQ